YPFHAMYTLDAYGGLHPDGATPEATVTGYWQGWNIARAAAMLPTGTGGFVLEGFGGVHPFKVGNNPLPTNVTDYAYWGGWDIARDRVLLPAPTTSKPQAYTLDGSRGGPQFGGAPVGRTTYYPGRDIARRLTRLSDG